uniref:Uncharacterized protein n=1 Tax=Heterorhabditis bacteriophora TaxID=37862 RepID=A0A1I7XEN4_HETBA
MRVDRYRQLETPLFLSSCMKGLLRTRQRPRAHSMLPLTTSASQDDIGCERVRHIVLKSIAPLLNSRSRTSGKSIRHKYYPISQEETLELLLLLNQVFIPGDLEVDLRTGRLARKVTTRRKFSTLLTITEGITLIPADLDS